MTEHQAPYLDRAGLRGLCEQAGPGPWSHRETALGHYSIDGPMTIVATIEALRPYWSSHGQENARFIAAARTAVPALLDALEAAEREIEHLKERD